eukprot:198563_1
MNKVTQSKLKAKTMERVMRQVPTINLGTISVSVLSASLGTATMHRTMTVQLTVEEEEAAQEPIIIAPHGLDHLEDVKAVIDNSKDIDTKWTTMGSAAFIIACIVFNMIMCSTYLCFSSKKKYIKLSEEVLMLTGR